MDFDQQTFAILALAAEARNAAQFMEQEEDRVRLLEPISWRAAPAN